MTRPYVAAELDAFADEIDNRLSNERADRQTICEDAAAWMRQLARQATSEAAAVPQAAELAARRTAAAAVLGDYRRATRAWLDLGERIEPDWHTWALRLAHALGQVLDQGAGLTPVQLDQLSLALADAIAYRDPTGSCTGCEVHSTGLCAEHAADLDRTDAYLGLAEALGLELDT